MPININSVLVDKSLEPYKVHNNNRVPVNYEPLKVSYTEDSSVSFPVILPNGNYAMVEVINDGHGGGQCSQWISRFILKKLSKNSG